MSTLRFYRILSLVTLRRLIGGFRGGNECEGMGGGGKRREGEVRRRGDELSKESRVDERRGEEWRGEERRGEERREQKRKEKKKGDERRGEE